MSLSFFFLQLQLKAEMLLTLNWNLKSYPKWLAWPSLARSRRWALTFQGDRRAVNKYFGLKTVLMLLVRCVRSSRRAQNVSDWNQVHRIPSSAQGRMASLPLKSVGAGALKAPPWVQPRRPRPSVLRLHPRGQTGKSPRPLLLQAAPLERASRRSTSRPSWRRGRVANHCWIWWL